jgi:hypothetical protein
MKNSLCRAVSLVVLAGSMTAGAVLPAAAGELKLTLADGRATLIAQDVPLRQILAEWARIGKTNIVNGEKLVGPPVTLQLVDRPEREVLEVLLRSASGYIASQRAVSLAGASVFESVMILPTSRGPIGVATSAPPSQFPRPGMPQPQPMPMPVVEDDEPVEAPVNQPPGNMPVLPPGMFQPPGQGQPQQPVLTAPRPGQLPLPKEGQPNPYGMPLPPGVRPPGAPGGPPGPGGPGA